MMKPNSFFVVGMLTLLCLPAGPVDAQEITAIAEAQETSEDASSALGTPVEVLDRRFNKAELAKFLQSRTNPGVQWNLRSYSSLLYAMDLVALRAADGFEWDGNHELFSPYPESYRPLWKEKLDMIARQIGATWSYNHDTGYWMLHPGPMPYPYTVQVAEGWGQRDQGNHVVFIPPIAEVGMDIYVLGHYTPAADQDAKVVFEAARAAAAMMWASRFDDEAAVEKMETRQVDGEDALYFTSPAPRSADLIWRQWSVVKNGWSILIVSLIHKDNEAELLPQVEAMVGSIRIGEQHEKESHAE